MTGAPFAAAAAAVPSWARVTVHVVLFVPPVAVTSSTSDPIETKKFGGGNCALLATEIVVWAM